MRQTILLYGATGYSGRLIAAEAKAIGMADPGGTPGYRMVLAGRDGRTVGQLALELGLEHLVFGLEHRQDVMRGLDGVDVVINAAGPFALTADHLAKGALAARCHYVDINGEVDVYMKLDDLARHAGLRRLALVCGAGYTAAASDLLLHAALSELRDRERREDKVRELSAIRIALSRTTTLSRGSLDALWRSLRDQVAVFRTGESVDSSGNVSTSLRLWHEPIGKLERTFDFRDHDTANNGTTARDLRIAMAANLVDTLTARLTAAREQFAPARIESYVEAGPVGRFAISWVPSSRRLRRCPGPAISRARRSTRFRLDLRRLNVRPTPPSSSSRLKTSSEAESSTGAGTRHIRMTSPRAWSWKSLGEWRRATCTGGSPQGRCSARGRTSYPAGSDTFVGAGSTTGNPGWRRQRDDPILARHLQRRRANRPCGARPARCRWNGSASYRHRSPP